MNFIKKFESYKGQKTYIEITEHCGWEGEDWTTYLVEQGNEEFIKKLEETIKAYSELENGDSYLSIKDSGIPENEVDIVIRRMRDENGYMDPYKKVDTIKNPASIDDSSKQNFIESFYKGRLLRN